MPKTKQPRKQAKPVTLWCAMNDLAPNIDIMFLRELKSQAQHLCDLYKGDPELKMRVRKVELREVQ